MWHWQLPPRADTCCMYKTRLVQVLAPFPRVGADMKCIHSHGFVRIIPRTRKDSTRVSCCDSLFMHLSLAGVASSVKWDSERCLAGCCKDKLGTNPVRFLTQYQAHGDARQGNDLSYPHASEGPPHVSPRLPPASPRQGARGPPGSCWPL